MTASQGPPAWQRVDDPEVIIVGAGTAGCVLAARLSEDRGRRVLLVEAGRDFPPGAEPAEIKSLYPLSYFDPRFHWPGLQARWSAARPRLPFTQGRLVGGSSMVMGMWALRGFPQDYDAWAAAGAAGWSWRDVLPFFIRAERDLDFHGEVHGQEGPLAIRRQPQANWPPFCRAVAVAARNLGLGVVGDMNAEFGDGVSTLPISAAETRGSAAAAYLTREVRARSNLRILAQEECSRVLFDGTRATGIQTVTGRILRASQVLLSAGALQSPAILMRSGIGPPRLLQAHGLPVVSARSGVGRNLQNHPVLPLGLHLHAHAVQPGLAHSAAFFCLRLSATREEPSDLYFSVLNRSAWHYFGRRLATIGVMLHKPRSRGHVAITSCAPGAALDVDFGLLSHPADLQRLFIGVRAAMRLLATEPVGATGARAGLVTPGSLARWLAHRTAGSRVLDRLCSVVLPLLPRLEERLMAQVLGRVPLSALQQAPEEHLASLLRRHVSGVFHPAGTCRMGHAGVGDAVVDAEGRVHGTQQLRVVDASIMPEIPRAGTFLPTVMIAEKIAAAIRSAHAQ